MIHSVADLRERFGVCEHTVLGRIRSGDLRAVGVGRTPGGHPPPAEDPLEPLHRSEIRASFVFMAFSLWRLLACVFCGLFGKKVKITGVLLMLGIGGLVALLGLAFKWPAMILAGGFATLLTHAFHNANSAVKIDEGPVSETDPSPLARCHRWAKRLWVAVTSRSKKK